MVKMTKVQTQAIQQFLLENGSDNITDANPNLKTLCISLKKDIEKERGDIFGNMSETVFRNNSVKIASDINVSKQTKGGKDDC